MKTAYSTKDYSHLRPCERQLMDMTPERMGKFGEQICKHVMTASGVSYIPLCDLKSGGAPMAVSAEKQTVLPDFDIYGGEVFAYLDAKVKSGSVRLRKAGQVRHGINKSNYEAYRAMGVLQRKQCGLFLVELTDDTCNWSGSLLSESFLGLGDPIPGFSNQKHMVYWPRDRFAILGAFAAEELCDIANGHMPVNVTAFLQTVFAAPPRTCPDAVHLDPHCYLNEPDPRRSGWIRTKCRHCGKWLGNHQVE